jgi:hypothetical protein
MYSTLKWRVIPAFRRQRMAAFLRLTRPSRGAKILDVGGLPSLNGVPGFWQDYTDLFQVTLMNLPGSFQHFNKADLAPFKLLEGDACEESATEHRYDIVFSNSVIEHVGSARRQQSFARFVRAAGDAFWVQTPSPLFPIEAHCDVPFWWSLPMRLRKGVILRWARGGNRFLAQQMASTRPISAHRLRQLFPDSQLLTERFIGFPKSQIAYRQGVY